MCIFYPDYMPAANFATNLRFVIITAFSSTHNTEESRKNCVLNLVESFPFMQNSLALNTQNTKQKTNRI